MDVIPFIDRYAYWDLVGSGPGFQKRLGVEMDSTVLYVCELGIELYKRDILVDEHDEEFIANTTNRMRLAS